MKSRWWQVAGINPTVTARALWLQTHPLPTADVGDDGAALDTGVGPDESEANGDRSINTGL
jgi:hypothetical protein